MEELYRKAHQREWELRSGLLLAWGYWKMGDTAGAKGVYQELLGSYPHSGECYGSYGCLLLETGADGGKLKQLYERGERMVWDKEGYNYQIWVKRIEEMGG